MAFFAQPIEDYIGRGITFPLELSNGRAVVKTGVSLIQASIDTILNWCGGQFGRFFLGEFDSKLDRMLEEPNDYITIDLIETLIRDALAKWEPRIEVISITAEKINESQTNFMGTYRIRNTPSTYTFIYPFYRNSEIIY